MPPSPPAFNLSQHQGLFQCVTLCIRWPKYWATASASVFPTNIEDWSSIGSPCNPRDSEEYSSAPQIISILWCQFGVNSLDLLYGPTLTSICDYWKNHSFDYMDLRHKVMSLLFNTLSRFVIAFLSRGSICYFYGCSHCPQWSRVLKVSIWTTGNKVGCRVINFWWDRNWTDIGRGMPSQVKSLDWNARFERKRQRLSKT